MKPTRSVICSLLLMCGLAGGASVTKAAAQALTRAEARALQQEFQQRYQRLEGMLQDMVESQAALSKRLDALAADLRAVERKAAAPAPDAVTHAELTAAIEGLRKAVQKQQADQARKITAELKRLQNLLAKGGSGGSSTRPSGPPIPKEGYEYTIKQGDTVDAIVRAYRKAGVKDLTVDLVLRANKGLKPTRLIPGKTIFIPDPGK